MDVAITWPLTGRAEAGAILNTRVAEHDVRFGLTTLRTAAGDLRVPYIDMRLGARLRVRIRARDVMIALEPPRGLSALNILPGTVVEIGEAEGCGKFCEVLALSTSGRALPIRTTGEFAVPQGVGEVTP